MTYIVLTVLAIVASLFGFKALNNAKVNGTLAENDKVKEDLKKTDVQLGGNKEALKAEEELRNQLREDMKKEKDEDPKDNVTDMSNFFNNRK